MDTHREVSGMDIAPNAPYLSAAPSRAETSNVPSLFDHLYIRHPNLWVALLVIAYLGIGTLFALLTPAWQAPDEPAHYNYIAQIATTGTLPILQWWRLQSRLSSAPPKETLSLSPFR